MDMSGIAALMITCCFVTFISPILTGIAFAIIYAIRSLQGKRLDKTQGTTLFTILYVISIIVSCIFSYFIGLTQNFEIAEEH